MRLYSICLSLSDSIFTLYNAFKVHPCCCKWKHFFFFWLNNIPLHMYLYILQFLYPFCWWTLRLLPCLSYCKECCSEHASAATAAKSLQSCPALCDSIDRSPPGSPVPGILQARTLEWVAISFSNAWKWKVKGKSLSHVWHLATPWTTAHQVPPSMGFSRQEYWSGVPFPSPGDLPHPGI